MNRRQWLSSVGIAGTTACSSRRVTIDPATTLRPRLASIDVAANRVIRTTVGLRPYRLSGFVLRSERLGSKTVIHNYGHGGCGVTLSWGTAHLAVEHAIGTGQATFAVIGCGAVGLATARLLQQRGYEVTIYARDLPPQTTSNAAGALWSPGTLFMAERATPEFLAQFDRATRLSYRYFQDLVGDYYGVRWLHGYSIGDGPSATFVGGRHRARFRDLYPGLTVLSERQNPFRTRYADRFQSMLIEPAIYLNALLRDFLMRGRLVVRDFDDADKLLEIPESTLVNCTGLGARELFGDKDFVPVKGQLSFVPPQADVDYVLLAGEFYMFPRRDGILLGGTHEEGVSNIEVNVEAKDRVLAGHHKIFERLS